MIPYCVPGITRGGALPLPVLLASALATAGDGGGVLEMRRIMLLNPSSAGGSNILYHPVADFDHDSFLEMAYCTGQFNSSVDPWRWEVMRFGTWRRTRVLYSDTAPHLPAPPGIYSGYFAPQVVGDGDRDGLLEIWGDNYMFTDTNGSGKSIKCVMEQRSRAGMPDTMTYFYVTNWYAAEQLPVYQVEGLDGDEVADIPLLSDEYHEGVVLENRADNVYVPAWFSPSYRITYGSLGFSDMDGLTEFMGGYPVWEGYVLVWEATGDNRYQCIWRDTLNLPNAGEDCFAGRDLNRNGRPEFFMSLYRHMPGDNWMAYLFMWEATSGNRYTCTLVDSAREHIVMPGIRSLCGDLDGDGIEEVAWGIGQSVLVYSAGEAGHLELVSSWPNDHNTPPVPVYVNIADVDYNGYKEILVASHWKVSVLAVEAVRLLYPNAGAFAPGDTCRISWQTFDPPRCDSVSLFLRRDSTYRLDTIAHGLAPADTPYLWVVPNIRAESAWVMAIAYGPGWQYDECDSAIRILGSPGVEEQPQRIWHTRLDAWPNPARGRVNIEYELARAGPVELSVLDAAGRKVALLASGRREAGRYAVPLGGLGHNPKSEVGFRLCPAPGVYFVRLEAGSQRLVRKVVIR